MCMKNISLPLCYNKSCAMKASSACSARANSPWRVSSLHVQSTSYREIKQTGTCCSFVLFYPSGKHMRWEEHPWISGLILLSLSTTQRLISAEKRHVAGRWFCLCCSKCCTIEEALNFTAHSAGLLSSWYEWWFGLLFPEGRSKHLDNSN